MADLKCSMKYICKHCGWIYDESKGLPEADIEPETPWGDIPDDFECPLCWGNKDIFRKVEE